MKNKNENEEVIIWCDGHNIIDLIFNSCMMMVPHEDFNLIDEEIYHEITCEFVYDEEVFALTYVKTIPISTGHSIFGTTVYVNKKYCRYFWFSDQREGFSWFILDLMFSVMHEIVHILFPQFRDDEEKIDDIAAKWLKLYDWSKRHTKQRVET